MATFEQVLQESYRQFLMGGLEELLLFSGLDAIAGVDEVGRGCLAGPVTAAAVTVRSREPRVPGVDDSKALRPEPREKVAAMIRRAHPEHQVVAIPPATIDRINILQATRLAMAGAVANLPSQPDLVLVDAVKIDSEAPTLALVRGDQISYAVACASILAKCERDRFMIELDAKFPGYGFRNNKGYGSAHHRKALRDLGPCSEHRLTFRSVLPQKEEAC